MPNKAIRRCLPQHGVTLLELVVVIAIAAILVTVAMPSFATLLAKWQRNSAVNAFSASLYLARSEAIKTSQRVRLCSSTYGLACNAGSDWRNGWIVFADIDGNDGLSSGEEILLRQGRLAGMQSIGPAPGGSSLQGLTFMPNGLLRSMPVTVTFRAANANAAAQSLVINRIGRARVATVQ